MKFVIKTINWLSSLKVAIVLLLLIALGSAIGTAIPQGYELETYLTNYQSNKFLGIIDGELLLNLQLNHVVSQEWPKYLFAG